jgi:hypothetical protein
MNKKLMTALLVPLMLIAVAGFGYAAFTSSVTESVSATAGTTNIDFIGTPSISFSHPYMTGTVVITDVNTLTVTASNFAPGDTATVTFTIQNTGSLPAALSKDVGATGIFTYSDNLPTTPIGASETVTVTATITLPSGTTTGAGTTVTFTVTITATSGTA